MKLSLRLILFILIMYLFALQLAIMHVIPVFQYVDELYALMCVPLWAIRFHWVLKLKKENKQINIILLLLLLFVGIGIFSNLVYSYQTFSAALRDVFINLKFFMGIATTYLLFRDFNIRKYVHPIKANAKFLILLYFVLVMQNKVTHVFPVADMRFGLYAEKIFFNHPTELASTTFFLLLVVVICYENFKKDFFYIVIAAFTIMLTLRFKALAAVLAFLYMFFIVTSGRRLKMLYLVPIVPFAVLVGGKEFSFYFFSERAMDMARGALSFTSLAIAKDTFPLGAGFGTFASWTSGTSYSPLYEMYGISKVWGLEPDSPTLVSDVFWPMILAQVGVIGLVLYVAIIVYLFVLIFRCSRNNKYLLLAGYGAMVYLLVSSIAESAFVNPLALPLAFVIGLSVCNDYQRKRGMIQ